MVTSAKKALYINAVRIVEPCSVLCEILCETAYDYHTKTLCAIINHLKLILLIKSIKIHIFIIVENGELIYFAQINIHSLFRFAPIGTMISWTLNWNVLAWVINLNGTYSEFVTIRLFTSISIETADLWLKSDDAHRQISKKSSVNFSLITNMTFRIYTVIQFLFLSCADRRTTEIFQRKSNSIKLLWVML